MLSYYETYQIDTILTYLLNIICLIYYTYELLEVERFSKIEL